MDPTRAFLIDVANSFGYACGGFDVIYLTGYIQVNCHNYLPMNHDFLSRKAQFMACVLG